MSIISIVVPVYNARKSLNRCLESLIHQSYKELEIILVDDGSTDGSEDICDKYAMEDQRICVIHKRNEGVSAARNAGIERATGTYLQFVDSDDYLDLDACKILVDAMKCNESEMVICGCVEHRGEEKKVIKNRALSTNSIKELSEDFGNIYRSNLLNIPWNKLFYRDRIQNLFDESISLGEDLLFNINYMKQIEKVTIIEATPYHYMIEEVSLSRKFRNDYIDVTCRIQREVSAFSKEKFDNIFIQKQIDAAFVLSFYRGIGIMVGDENISKKEKKSCLNKWLHDKEIASILKHASAEGLQEKVLQKLVQYKCCSILYLLLSVRARRKK